MGLFGNKDKNDGNNSHESTKEEKPIEENPIEENPIEEKQAEEGKKTDSEKTKSNDTGSPGKGSEAYCYLCRRPESIAGPVFRLTEGITVCHDCMQKTMDAINRSGLDVEGMKKMGKSPQVPIFNLNDIAAILNPKVQSHSHAKPAEKEKEDTPKETREDIARKRRAMAPHIIKEKLDEYVVGQEHAKKLISVAVYNHYKRVESNYDDDIEIDKSNILMIGPTGCGKTYLVKTLARILDVPLAIADATSLTEAGYIGDDIESVLSKLLTAADYDVERARNGIVFIDEIDKIAKKRKTNQRDVSGESVQQGMLKLLEGSQVEVPVGANSKNAMVPLEIIDTTNILFICGGAFPDLDEIIKERLNKSSSMGFKGELKDKYDDDENILFKVTTEDIRKYGMIPEFLGRLPVICAMERLSTETLVKILKDPKNAILKQYQKLLRLDEVDLQFDDDAIEAIALKAKEREIGARALRAIIEEFMTDIMYEIPKDDNIGSVTVTRDFIENNGAPLIQMRGVPRIASAGS